MKNEKKHTKAWQDLLTGCVAGVSDVLATHPLWTIKTLTQNKLTSPQILKLVKDNPFIIYNGVNANMLTMIPITTTRVLLSSLFEKYLDQDSPSLNLLSSGVAGGISSLFGSPTELARTIKLKSAVFKKDGLSLHHESTSAYKIMKEVYHTEGINKIFTGYASVAARDSIYTAAFFSGAPILKNYLDPYFNNPIAKTLVSFSLASLSASFINHPFDTIKTVQHSLFAENWQLGSNHMYGFSDACKKIFETGGIKGFFAGYSPRGARFLIGLTIKASVIEMMDKYWENYNSPSKGGGNSSDGGSNFLEQGKQYNLDSDKSAFSEIIGDIIPECIEY